MAKSDVASGGRFKSQAPRDRPTDDAYSELLSQTRGLRREQHQARVAWFSALSMERKEEILFELENAPAHRGMVDLQPPRRQHQAALPRQLEEENQVIPVEHAVTPRA